MEEPVEHHPYEVSTPITGGAISIKSAKKLMKVNSTIVFLFVFALGLLVFGVVFSFVIVFDSLILLTISGPSFGFLTVGAVAIGYFASG